MQLSLFKDDIGLFSPKQLEIIDIKPLFACFLNRLWHSVLPRLHFSNIVRSGCYVCYGAFFKGQCYAVAIWSKPIARQLNNKHILELRRMAISAAAPKNTASRMLSLMRKDIKKRFPDITKLISYQDTEKHYGTIYKASGWRVSGQVKYTSWNTKKRQRNPSQSLSDKIRWEIEI